MRVPNVRSKGGVTINMTPMIDVVFLLIIFFLVSSHLAKQENHVPLDLPLAQTGITSNSESDTATINVLANGDWQMAGKTLAFEELRRRLIERNVQSENRLQVRIRADQSVAYAKIKPLLTACAQAQIGQPVFAVYEQGRVR
jgi:biopolymer transport protein ExbD